jgi:hypothetical protein
MGKFLLKRDFVGIAFVIALIILAILANLIGWSGGADKILTGAVVIVYTIMQKYSAERPPRKVRSPDKD